MFWELFGQQKQLYSLWFFEITWFGGVKMINLLEVIDAC